MNKYMLGGAVFVLSLTMAACGGSGGGSEIKGPAGGSGEGGGGNGGNHDPIEGTTINEVSGLSGDANYQGMLFYTVKGSSAGYHNLMAIDPNGISLVPQQVMADIEQVDSSGSYHHLTYSIPKADVSGGRVDNYQIDRLMMVKRTPQDTRKLHTVSTDAGANWPPVTAEIPMLCQGFIGMGIYNALQFNLNEPAKSAFSYSNDATTQWCQASIDAQGTPRALGGPFHPVAPVWDSVAQQPAGWLMLKDPDDDDYGLQHLDLTGQIVGDVKDADGNNVYGNTFWPLNRNVLGPAFNDGAQVILAPKIELDVDSGHEIPVANTVNIFRPNNSGGTLTPLLNQSGTPLDLDYDTRPVANNLALIDGTLYFISQDKDNKRYLYSVNANSWKRIQEINANDIPRLLATSEHIVWTGYHSSERTKLESYNTVNGSTVVLDELGNVAYQDRFEQARVERIYRPLFSHTNGNIFYNRVRSITIKTNNGWDEEDISWNEAVARKADGSGEPVIIKDARWMFASTNGKGPLQGLDSLMHVGGVTKNLEVSEVFLVTEDMEVAAVNANSPEAGIVKLGTLDDDSDLNFTEAASVGELGAGPHRLLPISYQNGKRIVVYVNTREENSLKEIASADASTVNGF